MSATGPTPAEQHLGDRLAALVDGELTHDARDRVLAHLATCPRCKAEADAQRRLKNVFAQSAPPPLSESLLARLQGLPAGPGEGGGPFAGRPVDSDYGALNPSAGHPPHRRGETFGYVPAGSHAAALPGRAESGFRIHDVGRAEAERSGWRGRRFAFAAASAVSFAAIAFGGAVPLDLSGETTARGSGAGNKVTPVRTAVPSGTPGTGGSSLRSASDAERRRTTGRTDGGPVAAASPAAPPVVQAQSAPFPPLFLRNGFAPLPPLMPPPAAGFRLSSATGAPPAPAVPSAPGAPAATAPAVPPVAASQAPPTSPLRPLR
ncbi:zf-HC2 domain-containing protein [Streptomyces sanyensis]|uniref:Putative zinc-finger domain-containing protein n=1 Tax=Streptomyces sanyensis TaxID=568869 RepID=A0ABP9A624_9ACTN